MLSSLTLRPCSNAATVSWTSLGLWKASVEPHHFDLDGFDEGPLEGQTLYGIVEFSGPDAFDWAAEPGADTSARPTEFDDATFTFRRVGAE